MQVTAGLYRHYKGKVYMLTGIAKHSETLEEMVIYRAMYADPELGDFALWVRPARMFFEDIEVNGQMVPRFAKISVEESVEFLKDELMKVVLEIPPEVIEEDLARMENDE